MSAWPLLVTLSEPYSRHPPPLPSQTTTTYPSAATWDGKTNLLLAVASSDAIYAVDMTTAQGTAVAPLPTYNDSDTYLGLVRTTPAGGSPRLFLIQQSGIYEVVQGALKSVLSYTFPQYAHAAVSSTGGTNNEGQIWVTDPDSATLYAVDIGADFAVSTLKSGVNGPMDIAYDAGAERLIELASYQLYATSITTGKSTKLTNIPDGPGFPSVNAIAPDGSYFFFEDFSNTYTVDLNNGNTINKLARFTLAPRVVGFPQWIPTA